MESFFFNYFFVLVFYEIQFSITEIELHLRSNSLLLIKKQFIF